tara:strand:+ start:1095 stop:1580 length:486 start_codon:yes stop_codon:yes gene_type:complete
MKLLNTLLTVLLITLLPSVGWSTPLVDLVKRDGIYYPQFSDVPFTGKVTGKSQGSFKNGKKEGDWVSYSDNGQLEAKGNYKNGRQEGDWTGYWSMNGQLLYSITYKNGKPHGEWVSYHPNGELDDKGKFQNGKKEGVWVVYYNDGVLMSKHNYKDGVQISD